MTDLPHCVVGTTVPTGAETEVRCVECNEELSTQLACRGRGAQAAVRACTAAASQRHCAAAQRVCCAATMQRLAQASQEASSAGWRGKSSVVAGLGAAASAIRANTSGVVTVQACRCPGWQLQNCVGLFVSRVEGVAIW